MKKILLAVVFVCTLALVGCASQPAAQFVQLPEAERLAITTLVVAVLGLVFAKIGELFPWTVPFISKYKMEISLALAAVVVGFIENALPSAYPEISILFIQLVLAVLAAVGLFRILGKAGVKGFKAS